MSELEKYESSDGTEVQVKEVPPVIVEKTEGEPSDEPVSGTKSVRSELPPMTAGLVRYVYVGPETLYARWIRNLPAGTYPRLKVHHNDGTDNAAVLGSSDYPFGILWPGNYYDIYFGTAPTRLPARSGYRCTGAWTSPVGGALIYAPILDETPGSNYGAVLRLGCVNSSIWRKYRKVDGTEAQLCLYDWTDKPGGDIDCHLYAQWEPEVEQATADSQTDHTFGPYSATIHDGSTVTSSSHLLVVKSGALSNYTLPVKDGYTFAGFWTEPEGGSPVYGVADFGGFGTDKVWPVLDSMYWEVNENDSRTKVKDMRNIRFVTANSNRGPGRSGWNYSGDDFVA